MKEWDEDPFFGMDIDQQPVADWGWSDEELIELVTTHAGQTKTLETEYPSLVIRLARPDETADDSDSR